MNIAKANARAEKLEFHRNMKAWDKAINKAFREKEAKKLKNKIK